MAHPDDFDFYLEVGCRLCDHSLGVQKMPAGYHLMLDADGMYFFWMERSTGRESAPHWNKWSVYRGAKSDAARRRTPDMDGKKKLEELVALAEADVLRTGWDRVSHDTIRSISDAYKAMEAENERLAREALSSDGQAHEAQERALKAEAEVERLRRAVEFTAKMCWRTDPPNAVNTISDGERLSAVKFHPTIKKYGEPHEQLRVAESEARHEG